MVLRGSQPFSTRSRRSRRYDAANPTRRMRMARLPRYGLPGQAHHVIQRGNNRGAIFARPADYRHFREYLELACAEHDCAVHAYVLMTNHVHLLITPSTADGIGRVMQSVGRRYVPYYNWSQGRVGGLFQGRFRATPIDSDQYLFSCYRYIEQNPVRAGIVRRPGEYRWSSYHANADGEPDSVVTPHELYVRLGSEPSVRRDAYRSLHGRELDESTLDAFRAAVHTGWALGDDYFREDLARRARRRAGPLARGQHPFFHH
jgi:REP-associated tyrosine transposase